MMTPAKQVVSRAAALAAVLVLVLAAAPSPAKARVFEQCELARLLKDNGFPLHRIATYVCIAYYESRYDTSAVSKPNNDNSVDYGIFQINSRWWCDRGPQLGCGLPCQTLLVDMDRTLKCVKSIFAETQQLRGDGFKAWTTYKFCMSPNRFTANCRL